MKTLFDFGGGRQVFDAGAELLRARFGDNAVRGLKNAFAVTELNLIRNIVFYGGPRRNRNLVSISSLSDFRGNEMAFNEAFGSLGFSVNESEALEECYTYLEQKPNLASDHKLGWLLELQKTDRLESKTSPSVG